MFKTESDHDKRDREWKLRYAQFEVDAAALAGAVAERAVTLRAEASAEHARDVAGYKFDCRRHGDFIALFITRPAKLGTDLRYYSEREREIITSLNLGNTREMKLTPGSAPCDDHELTYDYYDQDEKHASVPWHVRPQYPYEPAVRPLLRLDPEPQQQHRSGVYTMAGTASGGAYRIKFKTQNFPRWAEDDCIRFTGPGASLFVPAGEGQRIYDKLLAEIGAQPTCLS